MVVSSSNVYPKDAEAPPCGVDDMTKLAYLHEPGVLSNLKSRYDINEIYVSSAHSLSPGQLAGRHLFSDSCVSVGQS